MNANIEVLAAWAQILSLPLSIASFVLTLITWIYPGPPPIAPIVRRVRPLLPYIFVAAFFFWAGTWAGTRLKPRISYDSIQSCNSYKIAILSPMSGETVAQNEVIRAGLTQKYRKVT